MPDLESAQNFATTQLLQVLQIVGHSWSQRGHMSNLMPDLESAQNFGSYNPLKTCFASSWSYLVTGWSHVKSDDRFGISTKFW